MTNQMRKATPDDVCAIMTALEKLPDEIPVYMSTEEERDGIRYNVTGCCKEYSWVSLDDVGHVVGFLLGKSETDGGFRKSNGQWVDRAA
jgi:hypothetical protein